MYQQVCESAQPQYGGRGGAGAGYGAAAAAACRQVPKQECRAVPRQECRSVPRQQCNSVPRQQCQSVPREQCKQACNTTSSLVAQSLMIGGYCRCPGKCPARSAGLYPARTASGCPSRRVGTCPGWWSGRSASRSVCSSAVSCRAKPAHPCPDSSASRSDIHHRPHWQNIFILNICMSKNSELNFCII